MTAVSEYVRGRKEKKKQILALKIKANWTDTTMNECMLKFGRFFLNSNIKLQDSGRYFLQI